MSDQSSAIGRLFSAIAAMRTTTIAFELAGAFGGAWVEGDGSLADTRHGLPDASGVVHRWRHHGDGPQRRERTRLGMPRELSLDREVAFSEVPRSRASHA